MKVPDRVSVEEPPTARKITVIRSPGDVRGMLFAEVGNLRIETSCSGKR